MQPKQKLRVLRSFLRVLPEVLQYQVITKLLMAVIVTLFTWVTQLLIESRGVAAFSNSDLLSFLLSPQGGAFVALGLLLLVFALLIELCGFVTISARSLAGAPPVTFGQVFRASLSMMPRMWDVGSVLLLLYLLILIPLTGVGVTISMIEGLRIPNFIMSVIESTPLYYALFLALILVLLWRAWRWMFVLHFMVIGGQKPSQALKNSSLLVRSCQWRLLFRVLLQILILIAMIGLAIAAWFIGVYYMFEGLNIESNTQRFLFTVVLLIQQIVTTFAAMLAIPFEMHQFTVLFRYFAAQHPSFASLADAAPDVPAGGKRNRLERLFARRKTMLALLLIVVLVLSLPGLLFFDALVMEDRNIVVIGHRGGGGFHIPENSLASVDRSIALAAGYVEIDVQRAGDGSYIINHDKDFKRLAGDARTAQEMTLDEIRALDIGAKTPGYEGERVPTLEELLVHCKGKIGVFIELKGGTADRQMADDIIRLVERLDMAADCVIMSLDYELIRYIEQTYETMTTGFCFVFAIGDPGSFEADIIILEEDAATQSAIDSIHRAGKKAVVWTVNLEESMSQFAASDVDGIITDDVERMLEVLKERSERTPLQRYVDYYLGGD